MKRLSSLVSFTLIATLTACVSAEPSLVAQAVEATLTAVLTPTPIVIVVTVAGEGPAISTVTPDLNAQQTLSAATQTVAAESATPAPTGAAPSSTLAAAAGQTQSTATPTAAAPSTPRPTAAGTASPAPTDSLLFEDSFIDPSLWPTGEDDVRRTAITDGFLTFTIKSSDQYRVIYTAKRKADDFYAALVGSAPACQFRDRYGLLFRVKDEENYYQFVVDCHGSYRLALVVNNTLTPLQDWTKSAAVNAGAGAENELSVRAQGRTLEVFANGQSLTTVTDDTFTEGGFGLIVGSGLSDTYTVNFDDLRVWKLKE